MESLEQGTHRSSKVTVVMSHLTATLLGYEVDQSLGVTNRK